MRGSPVRRPVGALLAMLALLMLGMAWLPAGPADAAPLPAPITNYATYPAGIIPAGCVGQGFITDVEYEANGVVQNTLSGFRFTPGTTINMSWAGWTAGCSGIGVSLAVKRADSPTFDPNTNQELILPFGYCGPDGTDNACTLGDDGRYHISLVMPPRRVACNWQVDAVVGPPLAVIGPNGSFYSGNLRGDNGPSTLLSAVNDGFGTDCGSPSPGGSALANCAEGGVDLLLTNTGEVDASFTLLVDGVNVPVDDVGPESERSEFVPFAADGTVHINLSSGDETFVDQDFGPCDHPAPTATAVLDCARGGVVVTITNPATITVGYSVLKDGTEIAAGTLAANGGTAEELVPLAEDEEAVVEVVGDGATILGPTDYVRDCDHEAPSASVAPDCAAGGIAVTVTNNSLNDVTFSVESLHAVGAWQVDKIVISGPGSETVLIPVAEDASVTIKVTADDVVLFEELVTRNCEEPSVEAFSIACAQGGAAVTLANSGSGDVIFEVSKNGAPVGDEVVVGPDDSVEVVVPMDEGETATIVVTSGGEEIDRATITRSCAKPAATIAATCTEKGAAVSFTNTGETQAQLTVTKNGTAIDTVTVDPGQTVTRTYAMVEDETATFRATAPGFDTGNQAITLDCQEVGGTKISALPRTGTQSSVLVTLAGFLLLVGGLMVAIPARPRRALA